MVSKNLLFLMFLASCVAGHSYCSQVGDQPVELAHELQKVKPDELAGPAMLPGAAQEAQPVEHVPLYRKAAYAFKSGLNLCRQYPVTTGLMAANIGVFAAQKIVKSTVGYDALVELGQSYREIETGQLWRLWTSCFLHEGLGHLASNLLDLLFVAHLEELLGSKKFLDFYMASGILSNLLNLLTIKYYFPKKYKNGGLGASGAIMGIVGVAAVHHFTTVLRILCKKGAHTDVDNFGIKFAIITAGLFSVGKDFYSAICEYRSGITDSVGHTTHIAGFATGIGLGWALSD